MGRSQAGWALALVGVLVWGSARAAADDQEREPDQPPSLSEPLLIPEIVVTATRVPEPLADVPASISVVEQGDIQKDRATISVAEPLNRVPGVFVQDSGNFAQDARIQIRGFGSRSAFGQREIRVLTDGLPETMPDGQTQLDSVDLGAIQRIEVLRGPASSLYGNASGGVIQFFTEDAPLVPGAELRLTGGSYGLGKYQLKGGGRAGNTQVFVQGSFFQLDGYRDHSGSQSGVVNAKVRYNWNEDSAITLLVNGVDSPKADDPGGLTREQADADPRQARALNVTQEAGETVQQGRVGFVGNHRTAFGALSAYGYVLYRDFSARLPIPASTPPVAGGVVTFQRVSPGGGGRYVFDQPILGTSQGLTIGLDVQNQADDRRRFANDEGHRGQLGLHQCETVTSVGPYVREVVYLGDEVEVSGGVRYDWVDFNVDVESPPNSPDAGSRSMSAWSPGGGIRYTPLSWLAVYGNAGTAFQTPTTTELANPEGAGFNPDVDPQTATSYELGLRGTWADVRAGLAGYLIDIDDELVPFESTSGRTAFRNAGRSRRYGLEVDWEGWLLRSVRWTGALTVLHAEYRAYEIGDQNFAGNDEAGIPLWQVYQEVAYEHPSGFYGGIELFAVDSYYADDANTSRSPSYVRVNLRAGYEHSFGNWRVAPFIGLNNVTDASYDGLVRLNALGGRYFEPAPGFNVYGGIAVNVSL